VSLEIIYSVAVLGLSNNEMRFIKIMLGLTSHASTYRAQGRYEWTDELGKADMVIVNSEDEAAMQEWHKLSDGNPHPILLLITATDLVLNTKYYFPRPFGPSKVLMVLDKIVNECKRGVIEAEIFSGASKSVRRENTNLNQRIAPSRHRALVVDDSPTVRKQLVLELGCFNIKVDTAESGEHSLDMLKENSYDIIFLDVVLPGVDGYQVCKKIRRNFETKLTPIIMLSSKSSPFDRVRGSLAGCSTYLTKPVDYENFYRILEEYLELTTEIASREKKYA